MQGIRYLIAVMVVLLFIAAPAGARTYEVISGYENAPAGGATLTSPIEVEFWELPVWLLVMQLACIPVELLAPLKFWGYLGYRRISRENLLDNTVRAQVFSCIVDHPGIHFHGIAQETGIRPGTLRYHLGILQRHHVIVLVKSDGYARFFRNDGTYSEPEQRLLAHLRRGVPHDILALLLRRPSATRTELAEDLGVAGPTITWHMKRLERDHLVSAERDGRCVRYRIPGERAPEVRRWLCDQA
ncbi:regulatory protein, ArsR [Methanoculleus bourgensis MS2]|jgi:predicted transcriptional regulator|uniref:Regulatory protein, ArsR n=1 Tax=Methanoculleus bourgensis (strain ATCC 43281 / DSM 3045 / OCM 15 / MS2) TaxID=1201294 RepID=I7KXS9_METBM|nr:winged helix-turn-helix transcriptional regulator [Methanoculleus bourgensis]GLI45751.1 transcriptional regulator [Methanoculleus bourgensis]CCJ35335.1 regulatory protein, ArsR [Methanoculleus bourgensis MS2]